MKKHSYLCIVSNTNGIGSLGDATTAALTFRPGLMGYKYIMTKPLPDGTLMGIYQVSFSFMATQLINRLKTCLGASSILVYDPVSKMISNTPFSDWEKMSVIVKTIRSEPALT